MSTWARRCMVIAAANQGLAQAIASALAPSGSGNGMWTTPCSPSGAAPATHFITEGCIYQQFADLMTDANALYAQVSAAGVTYQGVSITLAQCQSLLATGDVSTDPPFTALARLGLKLIAPPAP